MTAFAKLIHQRGLDATVRQARNAEIDFIDCYVAVFGRMPKVL